MKAKHLITFLFLAACLLQSNSSSATHAVAADLYYTWAGGNNYAIRVYFYRDCSGINAPSQITLTAYSATCGISQSFVLSLSGSAGVEVPPICNLGTSTCNGGSVFGIKEYLYGGFITLGGNCADWRFSWYVCCRNGAVTNLSSPGSQGQYFYAYLNNLAVPGNTSPRFTLDPSPFQCINTPFCFSMGATDLDGDSLVYSWVSPMRNATNPVIFQSGYTYTNPIISSPPIWLNTSNGNSCVWTTTSGIYVMAVKVDEYRNGVKIGTIIRDVQQNLTFCPCMVPLPVSLLDFSGKANKDRSITLDWSTATEQNSSHFILERSNDSENFDVIARVDAAGNSVSTTEYSYVDRDPGFSSIIYYRLKQVDINGHEHTLKTIAQRNDRDIKFVELIENPVRDEIKLLFADEATGDYEVTLMTAQGRIVKTLDYTKRSEGMRLFSFPVEQGSSTLYYVKVRNNGREQMLKVVLL